MLGTLDLMSTSGGTRLHVVTGKGGTGKTTVAAALALALACGGRRVLLCEVEGRQGIASVFDVAPLPYGERQIAVVGHCLEPIRRGLGSTEGSRVPGVSAGGENEQKDQGDHDGHAAAIHHPPARAKVDAL